MSKDPPSHVTTSHVSLPPPPFYIQILRVVLTVHSTFRATRAASIWSRRVCLRRRTPHLDADPCDGFWRVLRCAIAPRLHCRRYGTVRIVVDECKAARESDIHALDWAVFCELREQYLGELRSVHITRVVKLVEVDTRWVVWRSTGRRRLFICSDQCSVHATDGRVQMLSNDADRRSQSNEGCRVTYRSGPRGPCSRPPRHRSLPEVPRPAPRAAQPGLQVPPAWPGLASRSSGHLP